VVQVVCIKKGYSSLSSKGQSPGPEEPIAEAWGSAVSSPSVNRAEVDFDVSWNFKDRRFLSTAHYSPVILTANFNDFAFMLGMAVFNKVGLKSQKEGASQIRWS